MPNTDPLKVAEAKKIRRKQQAWEHGNCVVTFGRGYWKKETALQEYALRWRNTIGMALSSPGYADYIQPLQAGI
jgi:hypothetical protein